MPDHIQEMISGLGAHHFINRQNKVNEFKDEGNTSLYELNKLNLFNIGCDYLYRRALRIGWMKEFLFSI